MMKIGPSEEEREVLADVSRIFQLMHRRKIVLVQWEENGDVVIESKDPNLESVVRCNMPFIRSLALKKS